MLTKHEAAITGPGCYTHGHHPTDLLKIQFPSAGMLLCVRNPEYGPTVGGDVGRIIHKEIS